MLAFRYQSCGDKGPPATAGGTDRRFVTAGSLHHEKTDSHHQQSEPPRVLVVGGRDVGAGGLADSGGFSIGQDTSAEVVAILAGAPSESAQ